MTRKLLFLLFLPTAFFAQGYTSYFTGNATNITTTTTAGTCLMGGATEHDNAMIWLLQKANGGDVVVLRSSGSNGYNDYLYSDLGVNVNSVETLVITSVAGATDPYVLNKVANAEMIWFAGGDQWNYVSYFKNNALEDLINAHVNVKHAPIGGTSAGMAILGGHYFSAQNGSVSSTAALADPFNSDMTVMTGDFLSVPFLTGVITDTHYDNPDRRGRHTAFLARLKSSFDNVYGIACNEYVAVCIDALGIARVFGDYPNYEEFAYFIQDNCDNPNNPENLQAGSPLTWNFDGKALQVYKVPGTMNGQNYFDLNQWQNGIGLGGTWEYWSAVNGTLNVVAGIAPDCALGNIRVEDPSVVLSPNPFQDFILISNIDSVSVKIYDAIGKLVYNGQISEGQIIDSSNFASGLYILNIESEVRTTTKKLIKI